jgi:hypothetical protein
MDKINLAKIPEIWERQSIYFIHLCRDAAIAKHRADNNSIIQDYHLCEIFNQLKPNLTKTFGSCH